MITEQEKMIRDLRAFQERKRNVKEYIDYLSTADTESRILYEERNTRVTKAELQDWKEPEFIGLEMRLNLFFDF